MFTHLKQNRMLWALLASIGVNVFLVGFVFARMLGPRHDGPRHEERHRDGFRHEGPPHEGPRRDGRRDGADLHPRELFGLDGPAARKVLRERKERLQPERLALREARTRVVKALEAEPYQREALEGALSELRERTTAVQTEMHRALVDVSGELTPEQRRELVRKNFHGPRRRPRD
jgi:hypothetical protein